MVGTKDVARHAGVSIGIVSNVINRPDRVATATLDRVQAVIEQLGYVRSESARQLRAGRSRIIALLVLDMGNPFFADVARGAERAARAAGLGVMLCNSGQSPSEEAVYLGLFAEQRVRGVLITPADTSGRSLAAFARQGIPYVFVDRTVASADACSVSVDDVKGGTLAARHLITAVHRALVYISGPPQLPQSQDRHAGALAALAEAGLPPEALTHVEAERLDVAAVQDAGARLLGLVPRPTAVFCANDLLALGVLQTLFAAGVSVPGDIALVGYDDIEFAAAAPYRSPRCASPRTAWGALPPNCSSRRAAGSRPPISTSASCSSPNWWCANLLVDRRRAARPLASPRPASAVRLAPLGSAEPVTGPHRTCCVRRHSRGD